jgi:Flp pilus assembly protein TadG
MMMRSPSLFRLRPVGGPAREEGQSLVEFSLTLVLMLLILSAVIDLGRGYYSYIAIQNAAGEGALYAAINPRCPHSDSAASCADPNNVDFRAKHETPPGGLIDPNRIAVTVTYNDGTDDYSPDTILEGTPVTVTVTYRFNMIGPFSPIFPNGELIFTANAVQDILDLKPEE